jgi:cytochrome c nitrite reductase small subunit
MQRSVRTGLVRLVVVLAVLFGILVGVGSFTFLYGQGFSYFSRDPRACVNCHIMTPQYDSWQKSSHHTAAACVDCHLPHDFVGKYIAKADNGYRHSWAFTFQDFHEPIQITPRNARILQHNCVECHKDFVHELVDGSRDGPNAVSCVHCHADVGHGPRAGLGR